MTAKVIYSGTTHNTAGASGGALSADGFLDIKLDQPHPAAENLYGAAWSACYLAALALVRRVRILLLNGLGIFLLAHDRHA